MISSCRNVTFPVAALTLLHSRHASRRGHGPLPTDRIGSNSSANHELFLFELASLAKTSRFAISFRGEISRSQSSIGRVPRSNRRISSYFSICPLLFQEFFQASARCLIKKHTSRECGEHDGLDLSSTLMRLLVSVFAVLALYCHAFRA